ncbi:hypothetical protein LWI28_022760 [Acer negundo]|uniref:RRM domain-containing protein n=1 Tax=Acer negundo TaxID=4023 RepID=A0AAD5P3X8_ACENE|nr:hypothetical protein LWI28_022760 [Acer negundo]
MPIATIDTLPAKLLGYKEQLQRFLGQFTSSSILETSLSTLHQQTVIIHHESRIENVVFTIWPCYTRLVKDPKTQRPKGFGFVSFRSEDEAQKALEAMNGRIVRGRLIFVEVANSESPETGDSSA